MIYAVGRRNLNVGAPGGMSGRVRRSVTKGGSAVLGDSIGCEVDEVVEGEGDDQGWRRDDVVRG